MEVQGNEVEELSKAQSNIQHMKMRHKSGTLSELRSMTNPPTMVKTTLESVCLLLGEKVDSWRSIKAVISKNTFLLNIIQLKTEDISDHTIRIMRKKYLSNPLYTVDHVARVSTACAPLVKWCLAHVSYAIIMRGNNKEVNMEDASKRDSLGTDQESLEDSFELEEAAIEREEIEQVNVPVVNNERIEEVVEMELKEECAKETVETKELIEPNEEIAEKDEVIEPNEDTAEKEEVTEPNKDTAEKEEVIEPPKEKVEEKELIESAEETVEESKEVIREGIEEKMVSIEELSTDELQELNNTLPVEEEPIIKKVDTLCKQEDAIVNQEECLGREV